MRLSELNPALKTYASAQVLSFDCPSGQPHKIRVHVHGAPFGEVNGIRHWQMTGEFPETLTLSPSVNEQHLDPATNEVVYQCWHGTISNGNVQ